MNWFLAREAQALALIGIVLVVAAVVLYWALFPRGGREARVMRVPGAWMFVPLLIVFCLLSGGGLVYTHLGR